MTLLDTFRNFLILGGTFVPSPFFKCVRALKNFAAVPPPSAGGHSYNYILVPCIFECPRCYFYSSFPSSPTSFSLYFRRILQRLPRVVPIPCSQFSATHFAIEGFKLELPHAFPTITPSCCFPPALQAFHEGKHLNWWSGKHSAGLLSGCNSSEII